MANKVFANNREVACKAAKGKTICAFPDVCFTPPDKVPPTPPGVPIPYPNTGMASDTAKGSKKVLISDKEIILKNKSHFKTSYGDEAGCATKKGVITSKTKGKVYFQAWSMNVKVEGKNVTRAFDITTNNHASMPGDTPPWPYIDGMAVPPANPRLEKACKESGTKASIAKEDLGSKSRVEAGGTFIGDPSTAGDKLMASNAYASRTGNRRVIFAQGIRQGKASNIPGHVYPKSGRAKEGHAESKIIEELFKSNPKPKGTLYLKVNGLPICCSCQKVIESAEKSGVKVIVCPPDERDDCN